MHRQTGGGTAYNRFYNGPDIKPNPCLAPIEQAPPDLFKWKIIAPKAFIFGVTGPVLVQGAVRIAEEGVVGRIVMVAFVAAAILAGCASYDGRNLVPGKSTAAEVEGEMGVPAEKVEGPAESIWWYPRGPMGWHSYAVRIGRDGVLRGIEQRLTVENVRKISAGTSTRKEVRELFGPPFLTSYMPRQKREVWEYQLLEVDFKWKLWVQFSDDGVVREVLQMRHPDMDPPSDSGKD